MHQILLFPVLAAVGAVSTSVSIAVRGGIAKPPWIVPAALSAAFLGLTLQAVLEEGPIGFWTEHTRNLWGNQIWYDLLLAVVAALALLIPQAKAAGMNVLPWTLLSAATGSIGLTAFLARFFYLKAMAGDASISQDNPAP